METAAATGFAVLALAACGGGGGGDDGEGAVGSERTEFEQAALKHARCMREHGVDVPDPKPGGNGLVVVGPGSGGEGGAGERAMKACQKYLKDIPPPQLSEDQKEEMRNGALAHASCMREQGIDFPDPQFSEDGAISMDAEGLDPDSPKMRAANEACAKHLPPIGEGPGPNAGP